MAATDRHISSSIPDGNHQGENGTAVDDPFKEVNRSTVNSMKFFLAVINIMGQVHAESPKDVYDRLHELAGLNGVNLKETQLHMKNVDMYRMAALRALEDAGLIIPPSKGDIDVVIGSRTGSGYIIPQQRQQKYYDCMYEIRYNQEVTRGAKALTETCKSFGERKVTEYLLEKIDGLDNKDSLASLAAEDAADIKDIAIDRIFSPAIEMYEGYLEADRLIRGEDAPEITRELVSSSAKEKTSGIKTVGLVSLMNAFETFKGYIIVAVRKDVLYKAEERIRERRGFLGFLTKEVPALERAAKAALAGIDGLCERAYGQLEPLQNR